ncbi:MAG: hypothetical protein V2I82_17565 [Halieaceae bacterium]|nr:hypothetical protein [Halieaceae bacterium]
MNREQDLAMSRYMLRFGAPFLAASAALTLLAGPGAPPALGQHIEHPPIDDRRIELVPLPAGFKAYETVMACINDQRKMRTMLAREFERSPFPRGEPMERSLRRECRGSGGLLLGPSESALREQIEAHNRTDHGGE